MAFENFLANLAGAVPGFAGGMIQPVGGLGQMMGGMSQQPMIEGMGGLEQSLARNQAMAPPPQQHRKPGIGDIIGMLGDAFLSFRGQPTVYGPLMQKRQAEEQRQQMGEQMANYLGDSDGALAQIMRADPETGLALYKMTHGQEKEAPSAVREWEVYSHLPADQQREYRRFRSISRPQIIGSPATGYGVYDPEGGEPEQSGPPAAAIEHLRANPGLAPQFDEKYGQGAAASVLGGPTPSASGMFPGQ